MFPKIVRTEAIAATSSSAISLIEIGGILGTLWCGWFSDAYMVSRSMICSVCSIVLRIGAWFRFCPRAC